MIRKQRVHGYYITKAHASPSDNLMVKSGFGGCLANSTCLHCAKSEVWWNGVMVWGRLSGAGLGPLVPVKETLNGAYRKTIPIFG